MSYINIVLNIIPTLYEGYSSEASFYLLHPPKKSILCACVRLILVLVGGRQTAIVAVCTYYVPDTYVPGISRQTNVPPVDAHV